MISSSINPSKMARNLKVRELHRRRLRGDWGWGTEKRGDRGEDDAATVNRFGCFFFTSTNARALLRDDNTYKQIRNS
jgi:hypothetical protein